MPEHANVEGIIIKRINYKDADRLLTVYSKELGKISVIAKGIRKITSRKRSHLELMNECQLHLVKSHDFYIVTQADLIQSFKSIKSSLESAKFGYQVLEIFDKSTENEDPNEVLYQFLKKTLAFLDKYEQNIDISNAFSLKLLKILGFYNSDEYRVQDPELKNYLNNLEKLTYDEIIKLSASTKISSMANKMLINIVEDVIETKLKTSRI